MPVLYIKDKDGNFVSIPSIKGADGKSAYELAQEGGYTGTEEEFIAVLNGFTVSEAGDHFSNLNNPHKVTASQVGALPTAGGVMTDAIRWNNGQTHIMGQGDGNFIIQNYKLSESGNDDFIAFHNTLDLPDVLRISRNGVLYSVYGQHNKPKASDVGAVSKSGDTISGSLKSTKANWGQFTILANGGAYRAFEADGNRIRLDVRDLEDTTARRCLDIFSNIGEENFADAMKLVQTHPDYGDKYATILHTENINDYLITHYSEIGSNDTVREVNIRPTTQMVIVYSFSASNPYPAEVCILLRGVERVYRAINGTSSAAIDNVEWHDDYLRIESNNSDKGYCFQDAGKAYHFVLVG